MQVSETLEMLNKSFSSVLSTITLYCKCPQYSTHYHLLPFQYKVVMHQHGKHMKLGILKKMGVL